MANYNIHDEHLASCRRCISSDKDMLSIEASCDQGAVRTVQQLFEAATPATQGAMVSTLLTLMRPMQLRCLAAKVAVMTRVDFITRLAPEVGLKILQYLDAKSLCHAAQVARQWRVLADDDLIWHRMCEQHIDKKCKTCGWGLPIIRNSNAKRPRLESSSSSSASDSNLKRKRADSDIGNQSDGSSSSDLQKQEQPAPPAPKKRSWKGIYAERFLVERNWRKPNFHCTEVQGHSEGIMSIQYNDCKARYVTGGHDKLIRVWDADTNTCIKVLDGHTNQVTGVQFDDSKIVTCSLDRTIRIWSMKTFECIRRLEGHNAGINCIQYEQEFLASGSIDGTIRVWNISTGKYFTLRGHTDWVNKVQFYKKTQLFSCSDDRSVILWDLETRQIIRKFMGHHDQVQSMSISLPHLRNARASIESKGGAPKLVTASTDKTIKIWDIDTGLCLHTLFGHEDGVMCVASDTLRIVSGSHDNMVMVWDLESGKLMHSMGVARPAAAGVINCCILSDTKIMTGGQDGKLRVYDFYPVDLAF
ncbi:WD40-repeat-containing domain protein [Obelidium mucronatum]|nr:WD40-repeat-containing domain protein [Obelidium mucronatum]